MRTRVTRSALALWLLIALLGSRAAPARADVGEWTLVGPGESVTALAVHPGDDQDMLAAGQTGVWRTQDGGGTWTQVSTTLLGRGLSIDATTPSTVYGISSDTRRILKSADSGATWTTVYTGTGATQINAVLADPNTSGRVYAGVSYTDGLAQLLRSTDGGATWAAVLPASLRGAGGIGPTNITTLAAVPGIDGLVFAGLQVYHGGSVLRSADGGATWASVGGDLQPLAAPSALAAGGSAVPTATVYAGFNVMQFGSLVQSLDGGATWADLSANLPIHGPDGGYVANLDANPGQPMWTYLSAWDLAPTPQAGVFATPDGGATWVELGDLAPRVNGPQGLGVVYPTRVAYAATEDGVYQYTIAWPALPAFAAYYDAYDGYRLLGTGISLEVDVDGRAAQYFEKGRLEDHAGESSDPNWQLLYGLLVDELHASLAPLPVGGDVSTLSYADLHALADPSERVAPPPGYSGEGTMTIDADGTTFVPFTADLSGAPGHLVPGSFWEYVNRDDLFPAGWLHDIGLPISPAVEAVVTKYLPDGPAQRTITVQAFQRTILTDDPLNPPEWRVERANVGSDYRRFFPERVGP
ncbi:MAG TPA: hypothetical protein VK066_20870 [Chloroflexota bacterium]|nr:hypothetical protein [Chloroflexota bacterium]